MMHGNCKCFHHWVSKVLVVLAWVSAVAFWWAAWKGTTVWAKDAGFWFQDVVVFSLLTFGTVFCGCCRKGAVTGGSTGGTCQHPGNCSCGDCGRCKM